MRDDRDWKTKTRNRVREKQQGSTFKLAVGENCFRILPNAKGTDKRPYYEYLIHPNVGPGKKMVRCGKKINDPSAGECWLCDEEIPRLAESKKQALQKRATLMAPKEQMFAQVGEMDSVNGVMRGPLRWFVPTGGAKSVSVGLMNVLSSPRRQYDDPRKGYNLNVTRTGTMLATRYGPIEPDETPSKVPQKILNALKPFGELVPAYDEEYMQAAYYDRLEELNRDRGRDTKFNEDEDNMAIKKKKRSSEDEEDVKKKNKKKKKPVDDDEDEESEEEDDDSDESDDDDEDEKPSKKSKKKLAAKKKKKKSSDDDDDDDESDSDDDDDESDSDDDDDEEDEKPSKKKGKASKKKKKSKSDDDDEDESDDDEDEDSDDEDDESDSDDDEDEDDKPLKKKKKKKSSDDDDDDDESDSDDDDDESDSDDDDDEEDEKPSKKKKAKKKIVAKKKKKK